MVGIRTLTLSLLLLLPTVVHAQTQTITVTHAYTMGDNDNKNDARQLCLLEAKRRILEKVGSYVESRTEVSAFKLTNDQIRSFSAAVLSVEIAKEKFAFENGHNMLTLTVKADVDIADVRKRLVAMAEEKQRQERVAREEEQRKNEVFKAGVLDWYEAEEWRIRSNGKYGQMFDCVMDAAPHLDQSNIDCDVIAEASKETARKKRDAHLDVLRELETGLLSEEVATEKLNALRADYLK